MRKYKTQMEAAKLGIITPEMKTVAEKEYTEPETYESQPETEAETEYVPDETTQIV